MTIIRKEAHIEAEDRADNVLSDNMFRLEQDNKHLVIATLCGTMRSGGCV